MTVNNSFHIHSLTCLLAGSGVRLLRFRRLQGVGVVLVKVEVDRLRIVEDKIVLAVGRRSDVDVRTRVVDVHYVVYDPLLLRCLTSVSSLGVSVVLACACEQRLGTLALV